jgi:tripartite-type tricarboxylate transporter receptor subunit TctC
MRERLAALGVDPMALSPTEFEARVEGEIALNAVLARKAGLNAQ